jgi:hypothetical protein
MFKIDEKVVFIGMAPDSSYIPDKLPQVNEIVVIATIEQPGYYQLQDYIEEDEKGYVVYHESELRKLDYSFAEGVLARISEDINELEIIHV